MGFDLYGQLGQNKSMNGFNNYYQNSCWGWRPLWEMVCGVCADILNVQDIAKGEYNDGHLINSEKARKMGERLQHFIDCGEAQKYVDLRDKLIKELPDIQCTICKGTGQRDDAYVKGPCNGCEGKGTRRPDECHYRLDFEEIQIFADFCKSSGGFRIS